MHCPKFGLSAAYRICKDFVDFLQHNRCMGTVKLGRSNSPPNNRHSAKGDRPPLTVDPKGGTSAFKCFSACVQKAPSNACGPYRMSLAQWLDRSSRADPRSS